ncbi:MAG: pre-peptidase C-terminal domain-containing protein [Flavobacteriales bacterium]
MDHRDRYHRQYIRIERPCTGTSYEFQVLSVCSTGSSPYSTVRTFSTLVPCPDSLEPNNSTAAAATIALPASVSALIASGSDVDYYRFTIAATSDIYVSMSNLPGDYDVRLLDNTGAQLAISQAGGTTSEYISYLNAAAGTYYVHVFGYAGAFSALQCYSLYVSANASQRCDPPDAVSITGITWSEGTVSWPAVQGVSTYDLRWKESAGSTWVDVNGLSGTSHLLSGLAADTDHDVQVRAVCQGAQGGTGSTSDYTSTTTFRTLPVPCEVAPPVLLSVRLLLDGPYNDALGLMGDDLRAQGLLPLNEPYTGLGHALDAAASTTAPVLAVTGSNAIVDWVVVELRDATLPSTIVEARAGLLQRDGDVVGTDGTSAMGFCSPAGDYVVAVRHRNHLGVATAVALTLGPSSTAVDLTAAGTATYGTAARRNVGGTMTMWAGNSNRNGDIKYTGSGNDRDEVLSAIGGSVATNTVTGYRIEDCNMDGLVKYAGSVNDRDIILQSIGGSISTNVVMEQLP